MKIPQVTSRELSIYRESLSQSENKSPTQIRTIVFRMYKASHSAMASFRREGHDDYLVV